MAGLSQIPTSSPVPRRQWAGSRSLLGWFAANRKRHLVSAYDHCAGHGWQAALIVVCLTILQIIDASACAAQMSDVKRQGPWAYTHQFDKAHRIEFLATTQAEGMDVFLMLGCNTERVVMSFIHLNGFPYALRDAGTS
jgi:hypothetical protein